MNALLRELEEYGIGWETDCPLAPLSTFRIGGAAKLALFPKTRGTLIGAAELLCREGMAFTVIGNASNVLFSDKGYDGAILFTRDLREIRREGNDLVADCGATVTKLAAVAREEGLAGAEFLWGIPGTVGGGVFMNAGAFGGTMENICVSADWLDPETGRTGCFAGEDLRFSYRHSAFAEAERLVILGARFSLLPGVAGEISAKMNDYLSRRKSTQPIGQPSAGSAFKRPAGAIAAKLIDDCGLKGLSVGGAQVSEKHAGFIVNRGGATADDVWNLMTLVRQKVFDATGILLEPEIRRI